MNWQNVIENILRDFRLSIYDVERATGVSNVILHKLRTGKTHKPTQSTIKKLEEGLKIKIDDLNPNNITYQKIKEKNIPYDGAIPVKEYPIFATVYAGEPAMLEHENFNETTHFAYNKEDHRCFALRVSGNSMETTLRDGDIVLVDMDVPLVDSCLVAVKLKNGHQYIKRYYDLNNEFVKLTSDNSEYGVRLIAKNDIEACHRVVSINFAV